MINYQQITELFGTPLNTVPKPNVPFKFKPWHFAVMGIGAFLVYKGVQKVREDYFSKFKKSEDKK